MRKGSIWFVEEAHSCDAFGDDTGMILNWLREMRTTKVDRRDKIYYGGLKSECSESQKQSGAG